MPTVNGGHATNDGTSQPPATPTDQAASADPAHSHEGDHSTLDDRLQAQTLRRALQEIQEAKKKAAAQAFEQGLAKGHQEGLKTGLDEGRQQGYNDGYAEGYQVGKAKAKAQLKKDHAEVAAQLDGLVEAARLQLQSLDEEFGQALIALCAALARHIVHQEIRAQNYDLLPLIQRAIQHTTNDQPISIRVHPYDYQLLKQHHEWKSHWQLLSDESLAPGGFTIQAPWGQVDARLETRWAALIKQLLPPDPDPITAKKPTI